MWFYKSNSSFSFVPLLILVAVITQVSSNDETNETRDISQRLRAGLRGQRGPRGPPVSRLRRGYDPLRDTENLREPERRGNRNSRHAQGLILNLNPNAGGTGRPAQSQPAGLNLGLLGGLVNLGLGGSGTSNTGVPAAQSGATSGGQAGVNGGGNSNTGFPATHNTGALSGLGAMGLGSGMGLGTGLGLGLGGMPGFSGIGLPAQNHGNHGSQPGNNGQQNHGDNQGHENKPPRGPQGSQGSNSHSNNLSNGNQGRPNARPNVDFRDDDSSQNGKPGSVNHGPNGQQGQNGQDGHDNGQQFNSQNGGGGSGNSHGSQGGGSGKKKCRGNQYTCQNRECVHRNARCNGVTECSDASDEVNCDNSENRPGGHSTSVDRTTTAAPSRGTTATLTNEGCILPEQPTGGSFELGSCTQPCNIAAGTRVSLSSFLTYKCDEGYTLHGNNVSFCHGGSWYLPPTCVKTCSPLRSNSVDIVCKLRGEIVSCESAIQPGTKASLACKHSYKIPLTDDPAYRELTCLEDGVWDRTLFRCLPECGTAVSHGNTLIVNGFTAKLGVFPWHVGIYEKNSADKFDQICAGTLISPQLVVSAAHCFYDDTINEVQDSSRYAVGAGKHYRLYNMPEKYAQKSLVKRIDVASRYYGASGNFAEDISLVHLETPFTLTTLVRPICMDWENNYEREQLQSGQIGKAVGWGKNAEGVPSNELQEINLPYIPYQECVSAVPEEFKGYVTADKFCAGYLNGSSLCEGDSGGGLCFQLNGLWYLRGIVSVSPVSENTCDNNYYTAFTNVGRFKEWIRAAYVSTT